MRKWLLALFALGALVFPALAQAAEDDEFDPAHEWDFKTWVDLPFGLDITKPVAYLILGTIVTCLLGIVLMRVKVGKDPTRRQAVGEMIYEIAQVQVAEQGLPTKAISRWFPYVASLMLFIWTINMLGFIPLPLSDETWHGVPTLAIFAATSTL